MNRRLHLLLLLLGLAFTLGSLVPMLPPPLDDVVSVLVGSAMLVLSAAMLRAVWLEARR